MTSAIQEALLKIRKATSKDEYEDSIDELGRAARQNLDEVIRLFHTTQRNAFEIVWCLHGLIEDRVIDIYTHALRHKDKRIRWAAIEGLKYSFDRALIPLFIAALRDRDHSVKHVAVTWLASHGDARAIGPLERLAKLPGMIKSSPGTVEQAKNAVSTLRSSGV
jgi:HEAT repeat protein